MNGKVLTYSIHVFCIGMLFNATMDIIAWFSTGWMIPSWAAAVTWIFMVIIIYCLARIGRGRLK